MGGGDSMGHNSHSSGDGGDDDNMGHTNHNNSVRGSTKDHTNHSMGLSNPNTIAIPNPHIYKIFNFLLFYLH